MEPVTLGWVAAALAAPPPESRAQQIDHICTDTRHGAEGSLFFALIGENSDGHRYVNNAFAQGAACAVVSDASRNYDGPVILVPDTTRALGLLALAYRNRFDIPIIGVTGSIGKTTVKEMLGLIIGAVMPVLISEHNFNTEIGVPYTLFRLTGEHRAAVVEMGMRGAGQIAWLAEITRPTIGLITYIGYSHLELLGSREAIAEAKAELLSRLPVDGTAALPADDDYYALLRERVTPGAEIVSFGTDEKSPDVAYTVLEDSAERVRGLFSFRGERHEVTINAPGAHLLHNAAAALTAAWLLGIDLKPGIAALASWHGAPGRMAIRRAFCGATVIDDCYNASPESMKSALAALSHYKDKNRVAVLGEMRELGPATEAAHRQVAQAAAETEMRLLVTVGDNARLLASEVERLTAGSAGPEIRHFDTTPDAADALPALIKSGDAVLIKGSRALAMERIVKALTGECESYGHG
jgi:UDP-N-acetylmuramoyl-tripeptide--D-alanyl-D-alanine ligase